MGQVLLAIDSAHTVLQSTGSCKPILNVVRRVSLFISTL